MSTKIGTWCMKWLNAFSLLLLLLLLVLRGFVSHTPNATLTFHLDTRSKGAPRAFPQLTTQQKAQLLQRHGLFAAAAELLTADGTLPPPPALPTPTPEQAATAAAAAASTQIWQGKGVQDAVAEAERQAAAAAVQLRLGQAKPFVNSERVVGVNPYSTLQLPREAQLEVGKTQTATGVEVVLPGQVGRRLQQQQQRLEQQQLRSMSDAGASPQAAAAAWAVAPVVTSSSSSSSSSSRVLASATNPLVTTTPDGALYLRPSSSSSSSSSTLPGANSSTASAAAAPGTVGASIFGEYSFRPQPSMVLLIGYVKSHRLMGRARVSCISGCSCKAVTVDGWHASQHQRLATVKLHVTQSPKCEIGVQVLPEPSSGHHKFKVTGMLLAQAVHYRGPEGQWAHQYVLHPELLSQLK